MKMAVCALGAALGSYQFYSLLNATFNGAAQGTGTTTSGKLKLNTTDIVIRVGYKL